MSLIAWIVLGLIAGWGILLCNLLTFLFIPPALVVWDRNWDIAPAEKPRTPGLSGRWIGATSLAGFLVLLGVVAWHAPSVRYNTNLLDMQAAGTEPMRVQKRIEEKSESSLRASDAECISDSDTCRTFPVVSTTPKRPRQDSNLRPTA